MIKMGALAADRVNASTLTAGYVIAVVRNGDHLGSTTRKTNVLHVTVTGKDLVPASGNSARARYVIHTDQGDTLPVPGVQTFPLISAPGTVADLLCGCGQTVPVGAGDAAGTECSWCGTNIPRADCTDPGTLYHAYTRAVELMAEKDTVPAERAGVRPRIETFRGRKLRAEKGREWGTVVGAINGEHAGSASNGLGVDQLDRMIAQLRRDVIAADERRVTDPDAYPPVWYKGAPAALPTAVVLYVRHRAAEEAARRALECHDQTHVPGTVGHPLASQDCNGIPSDVAGIKVSQLNTEIGFDMVAQELHAAIIRRMGADLVADMMTGESDPYLRGDVRRVSIMRTAVAGRTVDFVHYEGRTALTDRLPYIAVLINGEVPAIEGAGAVNAAQRAAELTRFLAWIVSEEISKQIAERRATDGADIIDDARRDLVAAVRGALESDGAAVPAAEAPASGDQGDTPDAGDSSDGVAAEASAGAERCEPVTPGPDDQPAPAGETFRTWEELAQHITGGRFPFAEALAPAAAPAGQGTAWRMAPADWFTCDGCGRAKKDPSGGAMRTTDGARTLCRDCFAEQRAQIWDGRPSGVYGVGVNGEFAGAVRHVRAESHTFQPDGADRTHCGTPHGSAKCGRLASSPIHSTGDDTLATTPEQSPVPATEAVMTEAPARWVARGTTDDVTDCEQCGKPELKSTVRLVALDSDGDETGEMFVGSDCAARLSGRPAQDIRTEASRADRAEITQARAVHRAWSDARSDRFCELRDAALGKGARPRDILEWSRTPDAVAAVAEWDAANPRPPQVESRDGRDRVVPSEPIEHAPGEQNPAETLTSVAAEAPAAVVPAGPVRVADLVGAERVHVAGIDQFGSRYVCKGCGKPSPTGVGYADNTPGAAEKSDGLTACECGCSQLASAAAGQGDSPAGPGTSASVAESHPAPDGRMVKRPTVGAYIHHDTHGVCEVVAVHGRGGEDIGVRTSAGERLSLTRHPRAHWLVVPAPAADQPDEQDDAPAGDGEPNSIYRLPVEAYTPELASDADAELTIRHDHEDGTVIEGSSRGDGVWEIAKGHGLEYRRGVIFKRHSRDRFADLDMVGKLAAALREAGLTVAVEVDDVWRPAADREDARAVRVSERAGRLAERASKKFGEANSRYLAARNIGDGMPFGEPIKVGHHSERRHRRAFERIEANDRASYAARDYAEDLARRAGAAERNEDSKHGGRAIMRRIDTLKTDRRAWIRRLADTDQGTTGYARTCRLHIERLSEDIAFQLSKLGDMAASGAFVAWSAETVQRGDLVNVGGSWHEVARVNRKGVSVRALYQWHTATDITPVTWDQIHGRRRDGVQLDTPNGEGWPIEQAAKVARWANLVSRYQTCTSYDRGDREEMRKRHAVCFAIRIVLGLDPMASAQEVAAFGQPATVDGQRARALAYLAVYDRLEAGERVPEVVATVTPIGDTVPAWRMPAGEPEDVLPRDLVPGDIVAGVTDGFSTMRTVSTSIVGPVESVPVHEGRRESGDWYHVTINGEKQEIRSHRWLKVHRAGAR